jgi:putative DNA methylase
VTEHKKKLIEVALPLEAINRESARENYIYKGNPSSVHKWWSGKPLSTCRAVLFASLVDDPSAHPTRFPTPETQEAERRRLFGIIEELVKWENSANESVLENAREEIMRSTEGSPPPVLDPFCGGGSIPLEAQRLGLEAHASDLNPVAVLITKALIEMPPRFAGLPPVNPGLQGRLGGTMWTGTQGLAEDVRHYGCWIRDQAKQRIGSLYPNVRLPVEHGGGDAAPIAWLWVRTVKCPNPACGAEMLLTSKWTLSTRKGRQVWVEPIVEPGALELRLELRTGDGPVPGKTVDRSGVRCIACGTHQPLEYVRSQGRDGKMGTRLLATVAVGKRGRVYVAPDADQMTAATAAPVARGLDSPLADNPRYMAPPLYGMTLHRDLYSDRQLAALTTFSDLVADARNQVLGDIDSAVSAGRWSSIEPDGAVGIREQYADALATLLAFAIDKVAEYSCTLVPWYAKEDRPKGIFARQAVPMVWDYAEINPLGKIGGTLEASSRIVADAVANLVAGPPATVLQLDAAAALDDVVKPLVSTDPPYYDNIAYADLSDFFYVWLRRSLGGIYPSLFSTLLTPKAPELVASAYRFDGDKQEAQAFFERGLQKAFERMRSASHDEYPVTVYYAFKQAESEGTGESAQIASTGWETMLAGLLGAGFSVHGTWPMRSERVGRSTAIGTNALASSVVLVCRRREVEAALASRREFITALRAELPTALRHLQQGNIAPVDLAQASIGPGMAVFSRYSKVMEADGSHMSVRTALALINQALDDVVAEQEGEFDADTRWAIAWFQEVGMEVGDFGRAELLSRAKNTAVQGMVEAGIVEAKAGKVRLLRRDELDESWDPATDKRLTVWEMTQHLIRRLDEGEATAAALARRLGSNAEVARDLAYRLYLICERKKWAQEALAYNGLVVAWPGIMQLATTEPASAGPSQTSFEV